MAGESVQELKGELDRAFAIIIETCRMAIAQIGMDHPLNYTAWPTAEDVHSDIVIKRLLEAIRLLGGGE